MKVEVECDAIECRYNHRNKCSLKNIELRRVAGACNPYDLWCRAYKKRKISQKKM